MSHEITEHDIELPNGAIAHYAACGPEAGEPVILLHGGLHGSSGRAGWSRMMPALADAGFRVYAPDRPGYGQADTREQYWPTRGFLSWVRFVEDFADALGLETFLLGGNSEGAQTAAQFTVRNPDRVRRLALIASGGLNGALDIPADQLKPGIPFPAFDGTEQSMADGLTAIVLRTETITPELVAMRTAAANVQLQSRAAAVAWNTRARTDENIGQAHRLTGHLDRLTIPIIYLYGMQDVMGPVENAYLQEDRLPNVQFFYPENCGHQGQTDQPEMHHAVFTEFFTTGQVSRATADWAGVSKRRPELPGIIGA